MMRGWVQSIEFDTNNTFSPVRNGVQQHDVRMSVLVTEYHDDIYKILEKTRAGQMLNMYSDKDFEEKFVSFEILEKVSKLSRNELLILVQNGTELEKKTAKILLNR